MPVDPRLKRLYEDPQWKALRVVALERAANQCERCGSQGRKLNVHPRVPLDPDRPELPSLDGVEVLCTPCNTGRRSPQREQQKRDFRKLFERVIAEEEQAEGPKRS